MNVYPYYAVADGVFAFSADSGHVYALEIHKWNISLFDNPELDKLLVTFNLTLWDVNGNPRHSLYSSATTPRDGKILPSIAGIVKDWYTNEKNRDCIGFFVLYNEDHKASKRSAYFSRMHKLFGREDFQMDRLIYLSDENGNDINPQATGDYCFILYRYNNPFFGQIHQAIEVHLQNGSIVTK